MKISRLILITLFFTSSAAAQQETEVAARFAPVFYQALGDKPRSDYITNFDFDGDWIGTNNWDHAGNQEFPLKGYIYFSVCETSTHYYIHYAVFHPRDYKGGEMKGAILSGLIREGAKRGGQYDPTGLADETSLAHENDMEGALVVVKKEGSDPKDGRVVFVETLHHNQFGRYQPGDESSMVRLEAQHPLLYVEPKGHGIEAFNGDKKQVAKKDFLRYASGAQADNPAKGDNVCSNLEDKTCDKSVSYQLVPLSTLWTTAKGKTNQTYGVTNDYADVKLSLNLNGSTTQKTFKIGKVGCAFAGSVGGINMARPPWGWFDRDERDTPLGQWFFDPATKIKHDFKLDSEFSITYVHLPFWAK
jgi:hypothetical protein